MIAIQKFRYPQDLGKVPGRAPRGGYLYAVRYHEGPIKIGRTVDPRRRVGQHSTRGAAFGYHPAEGCLSPAHANYQSNERALIVYAKENGISEVGEFFRGLSIIGIAEFMASLTYDPAADAAGKVSLDELLVADPFMQRFAATVAEFFGRQPDGSYIVRYSNHVLGQVAESLIRHEFDQRADHDVKDAARRLGEALCSTA